MLIVGSDDGVYRVDGVHDAGGAEVRKVLDSGRVMRLRSFDGLGGALAATTSGLHRSLDGETWTDLGVPREEVYAVGASPDGDRLYAGTRPAAVYVARTGALGDGDAWRECDAFPRLPSRGEWRLPRHENLAQVRDVHVPGGASDRVVAGVEVGGVHVSEDGGETWTERRHGVHDDVHELHVVGPSEFVAATGDGLYRTTDAGRSWTRLDDGVEQSYFRSALAHDGTMYAGGALSNSSTWDDPDADPALFTYQGGPLRAVDHPRPDETVTGLTVADGAVVAGTHRGTVLAEHDDGWAVVGSFPVPGDLTGRYTPLAWVEG